MICPLLHCDTDTLYDVISLTSTGEFQTTCTEVSATLKTWSERTGPGTAIDYIKSIKRKQLLLLGVTVGVGDIGIVIVDMDVTVGGGTAVVVGATVVVGVGVAVVVGIDDNTMLTDKLVEVKGATMK